MADTALHRANAPTCDAAALPGVFVFRWWISPLDRAICVFDLGRSRASADARPIHSRARPSCSASTNGIVKWCAA